MVNFPTKLVFHGLMENVHRKVIEVTGKFKTKNVEKFINDAGD